MIPKFSAEVHRAFAALQAALDGLRLVPDDVVLVACSGGADSLALAVATAKAAQRVGRTTRQKGFRVRAGAIIVNHNLHLDAAAVAAKAAATCRQIGLDPVIVKSVNVEQHSPDGLEAAARAARYQAFAAAAAETGAKSILLGHTMDDQAESVLLGLARGSGARSLAGIAPRRFQPNPVIPSAPNCSTNQRQPRDAGLTRNPTIGQPSSADKPNAGNIQYLRPFLRVRRRTTEEICHLFNLTPWHDPTNYLPTTHTEADPARDIPTRTHVRAIAIPAISSAIGHDVIPALARTADLLRDDADALDQYAADLFHQAQREADPSPSGTLAIPPLPTVPGPSSALNLDIAVLTAAPKAVRTRALRLALLQLGIRADAATRALVLALDALVTDWHGQGDVFLPGGIIARRNGGILSFDLSAAGPVRQ